MLADIAQAVITQVAGRVAGLSATAELGAEHWIAEGTPPRVVWVPTSDRFDPPAQEHRQYRAYRTRVAGVELRIWGADIGAVETLVNELIVAIHDNARGAYELGAGRWDGQDGAELLELGRAYVLSLTFRIPVTLDWNADPYRLQQLANEANHQHDVQEQFPSGQTGR